MVTESMVGSGTPVCGYGRRPVSRSSTGVWIVCVAGPRVLDAPDEDGEVLCGFPVDDRLGSGGRTFGSTSRNRTGVSEVPRQKVKESRGVSECRRRFINGALISNVRYQNEDFILHWYHD